MESIRYIIHDRIDIAIRGVRKAVKKKALRVYSTININIVDTVLQVSSLTEIEKLPNA